MAPGFPPATPFTGGPKRRPMAPSPGFAGDGEGDLNMRFTVGLAAMASLCLLAACNRGGAGNDVANAPAEAAAPAGNGPAPAAPDTSPGTAPANGAAPDLRTEGIAICVETTPGHLPAGIDANAFCTCAVDKVLADETMTQREAMSQCAAQMNIRIELPPAQR